MAEAAVQAGAVGEPKAIAVRFAVSADVVALLGAESAIVVSRAVGVRSAWPRLVALRQGETAAKEGGREEHDLAKTSH
jgi:hypothetical protein